MNGCRYMSTINEVRMLEFKEHGDERGYLVVVEGEKDLPFKMQRSEIEGSLINGK